MLGGDGTADVVVQPQRAAIPSIAGTFPLPTAGGNGGAHQYPSAEAVHNNLGPGAAVASRADTTVTIYGPLHHHPPDSSGAPAGERNGAASPAGRTVAAAGINCPAGGDARSIGQKLNRTAVAGTISLGKHIAGIIEEGSRFQRNAACRDARPGRTATV